MLMMGNNFWLKKLIYETKSIPLIHLNKHTYIKLRKVSKENYKKKFWKYLKKQFLELIYNSHNYFDMRVELILSKLGQYLTLLLLKKKLLSVLYNNLLLKYF